MDELNTLINQVAVQLSLCTPKDMTQITGKTSARIIILLYEIKKKASKLPAESMIGVCNSQDIKQMCDCLLKKLQFATVNENELPQNVPLSIVSCFQQIFPGIYLLFVVRLMKYLLLYFVVLINILFV